MKWNLKIPSSHRSILRTYTLGRWMPSLTTSTSSAHPSSHHHNRKRKRTGKMKKKIVFFLCSKLKLLVWWECERVKKFVQASEHEFFCHLIFSIVFTSSSSQFSFCSDSLSSSSSSSFFYEFIFSRLPFRGSTQNCSHSQLCSHTHIPSSYHYCLNIQRFLRV